MKYFLSFFLFGFSLFVFGQNTFTEVETDTFVDTKYKEDQFYIGVSYNLLAEKPDYLSQSGFSIGAQIGKIFDIPVNKARNFGFGIGVGYALDFLNHNLAITKDASNGTTYEILDADDFSRNRSSFHSLEMPLEIRWRTSNATSYKFWRVYGGIKFSYVIASNSKLKASSGTSKVNGLSDLNKLQYGLTLSAGYDTWNVQIYYGLNSLFNDVATTEGVPVDMKLVKIGLIFYLL
jgi:hypothetical protein